ncbi:MAG: hypothetical protein ACPGVU_16765 [Limisphaerales bacterium]
MSEETVAKKSSTGKIIGIGCLVIVVLAVVGGILVVQAVKGFANKTIEKYTDSEPVELAAVNLPEDQAAAVEERVKAFGDAMEKDGERPPLELDSDEINYLITQNEDFANMLRVNMDGETLEGTISAPLDGLQKMFKAFEGRYFNGSAVFDIQFQNGRLQVYANAMSVKGESLPEQFMQQIRNENFAKDATKDPKVAEFLNELESITIEDGKLKIVPKSAAPEPTPQPSEDGKKSEDKTEDKTAEKSAEKPAEAKQ